MQNVAIETFMAQFMLAAAACASSGRPKNTISALPELKCHPATLKALSNLLRAPTVGIARRLDRAIKKAARVTRSNYGGVGLMNHCPDTVAMSKPFKDHTTQAVVSVEIRRAGCKPIALIAAYIPCAGAAAYKSAELVEAIYAKIEEEYRRLKALYPSGVFIMLDANGRLGVFNGRKTADNNPNRAVSKRLEQLCRNLGVSPIAGREGLPAGSFTSRNPNGSAGTRPDQPDFGYTEIDFILTADDIDISRLTVHEPQPWHHLDMYPGITHRMQYVTVTLERDPAAGPAPPAQPKPPPKWPRVPNYDDIDKHDAAAKVLWDLLHRPENADLVTDSACTGTERRDRLFEIYKLAAQAADPGGYYIGAQGAQPAPRPKLYKGFSLPRHILDALRRAKALRRQASRLRAQAEGGPGPPTRGQGGTRMAQALAAATAERAARAEQASIAAKQAKTEAAAACRRFIGDKLSKIVSQIEHLRVHGPATMHKVLKQICPENGRDVDIDSNIYPGENAPQRFLEFYRQQYCVVRPQAVGPSDPSWPMPQPKHGTVDPARLLRKICWREVYLCKFPHSPSIKIPECVGGGPNCVVCAHVRRQHNASVEQGFDSDAPDAVDIPTSPQLSTTSVGGPDGMDPRSIRHARFKEPGNRTKLRIIVCKAEAAMFNKWLFDEGRVPDSVAQCLTTLILKRDKEGNAMPGEEPNSYRGITMGNVFAKQLAVVLARRLSHWAVAEGLVSPEQVGFMPMQGCEDQVTVLTETIRHYWADKRHKDKQLCAVFIDFKKAYDYVQPSALWHICRQMGMPEQVVNFLATWSNQRTTTLTINGTQSEPWTMRMGVAQGDPLSPLLFNLFMEPLIRHVKASQAFTGVSLDHADPSLSLKYKLLVYADDIVLLCENPAQAAVGVALVQEWATAWGMELGVGAGKTEAMMFRNPRTRAAQPAPPAPIPIPGTLLSVGWTDQYKYLGYILKPDLNTDGMVERMISNVDKCWKRYFYGNPLMRMASPVLALQLYRTCILGSSNYLLGLIEPTAKIANMLDKHSLEVVRCALRMGQRTPRDVLWSEGRLTLGQGIMARERVRPYFKAKLTPIPDSLLRRIVVVVEARPSAGANLRTSPTTSWFARTKKLMQEWHDKYGIPIPQPQHYGEIPRVAAVTARALSMMVWQSEARSRWRAEMGDTPMPSGPVMTDESRQTVAAAYLNHCYPYTVADLGSFKTCTSLEVRGPGASGGMLSYLSKKLSFRQHRILACVRRGREGWYDPFRTAPFNQAEVEARKAHSSCNACRVGDHVGEGPQHACTACSGPAVTAMRAQMVLSLPDLVSSLVRIAYTDTVASGDTGEYAALLARDAAELARGTAWASLEGQEMLFRLLLVEGWPTPAVGTPHSEMYTTLAKAFRAATRKPHLIRPMSNTWAPWAAKWLLKLHESYYSDWQRD